MLVPPMRRSLVANVRAERECGAGLSRYVNLERDRVGLNRVGILESAAF